MRCLSFFYRIILPSDSVTLRRMSYNVIVLSLFYFLILRRREIFDISCTALITLNSDATPSCDTLTMLRLTATLMFCFPFNVHFILSYFFLMFLRTLYAACTAYATDRHLTVCSPCRTQLLCRRYRQLQPPCVVAPDASTWHDHSNHIRNFSFFLSFFLSVFLWTQAGRPDTLQSKVSPHKIDFSNIFVIISCFD